MIDFGLKKHGRRSWFLIPTIGTHFSKKQGFQVAILWLKWWLYFFKSVKE